MPRFSFKTESAASTLAEHPLLLSVNSTKPSCLAQWALVGALPDGGDDGSTADRGQRQRDEMQRRGSSSDAGQLIAVLGVHGSPVLPARTSGLPIRARA
jgi:hypothetical protein